MWKYETSLTWNGAEGGEAATAGKPSIAITPPTEFGGKAGRWNPELLLVSAVESCLLLTTLSIVQRQKIALKGYTSTAVGHMEKTPGGLRFTGIDVAIRVTAATAEDAEKADKAVKMAEKYCPVSNAVNCPVHVTVEAATQS
jgi:organic hydroperoxide reductase OsmC/OhrA